MLNDCLGQLRFTPSGHVAGIDMNAALKIAEVRGFDVGIVSELLCAAENGLIEAMQEADQSSTTMSKAHQGWGSAEGTTGI